MKRLTLLSLLMLWLTGASAVNTKTVVEQVTAAVTLTEDVDFHISSAEPFTATGSLDIKNVDQAVVIFDNLRPSQALAYLGFISINGQKAANRVNCYLKIYNRGAILMPHSPNIKPLTTYTEPNFEGESCNNYTIGHKDGFMRTLSTAQLNNRIKSFRLKRGYMVTFSLRDEGRGYSRCFIADKGDIEVNLPPLMAGRVSSYRIFHWNDCSKSGIADNLNENVNALLHTTWSYTWGEGRSMGTDFECVPHMNHIYGPSASTLGSSDYSPHIKTDNEPGNSADPQPASVEQVLARWEDLMRTGKRLMTPSSHDGSIGWMNAFVDSIDKRGWRCDIVDVHSYWVEGTYNGLENNWYKKYRRPIWISEFLWGASWNNNGIFGSGINRDNPTQADLELNKTNMSRILNNLNKWGFIERYAYWNGERNCSKIYMNGKLTPLGEFYANMDTGVGYNSAYDYIPSAPPVAAPRVISHSFTPSTGIFKMTFRDSNGELNDSVFVERKVGDGPWECIYTAKIAENGYSYVVGDTISEGGMYAYRTHALLYNGRNLYSPEVYNVVGMTEGEGALQFGKITTAVTDNIFNFFAQPYDKQPVVVFGGPTAKTLSTYPVEQVGELAMTDERYTSFGANMLTWTESAGETPFADGAETSSYLVVEPGNGTIGSLNYEAGMVADGEGNMLGVGADVVEVKFNQPFAEAPMVMVTTYNNKNKYPVSGRAFDVSNEGFKLVARRQHALSGTMQPVNFSYFAIDKGEGETPEGKKFMVGADQKTFRGAMVELPYGSALTNPAPFVQLQTQNRDVAGIIRIAQQSDSYMRVRLQLDPSSPNGTLSSQQPAKEIVGWMVVSDDPSITAIRDLTAPDSHRLNIWPTVATHAIGVKDAVATSASVYSANGACMMTVELVEGQATIDVTALPAGIYVIRTNANHSGKMVKR